MAHIDLETKILNKNDELAAENRAALDEKGVYMVNVLASPGSGKTSTIVATINALRDRYGIAVIEGDIASDVDSQTIKNLGIPAVQINTAGTCHLESDMLKRALDVLDLDNIDLIFIENVGNLVCPADFYLGENIKMMILSVPEGDDKPLKYPGMFQAADAIILNKVDVMPAFTFDKSLFDEHIEQLNPNAPCFAIAATKGEGVDDWANWLSSQIEAFRN
jgi:hydrogenase nickel incorporation protein HypB